MMALDNCRVAKSGFDNVGINSTLNKIINLADLLSFFLKYADKFLADYLALCFRLSYSGKLAQEAFASVNADEINAAVSECSFYLVALVLCSSDRGQRKCR